MKKFLVDEYHLFYSPSLAAKVGRSAALILQRAYYWMGIKGGKMLEGIKWFYKTYEAWAEELCLSVSTVRRAIASLKSQRLIQVKKLSADSWYQANWYTVNFADVEILFSDEQIDTTQTEKIEVSIPVESICSERTDLNNRYDSDQNSTVSFSPAENEKNEKKEKQNQESTMRDKSEVTSDAPKATIKVNCFDQFSAAPDNPVEKPIKRCDREKEVWEAFPGQPYLVFVQWWSNTNYKEQGGHLAKGASSHARSQFYNDREHTTTILFPLFLQEITKAIENCNQMQAAGIKAVLPSYFIVPPEATEENVQAVMSNLKHIVERGAEVALPQGIATPSCNQSMSFAKAQDRAIAPLLELHSDKNLPPHVQAILGYLEIDHEPAARAIALRHGIDINQLVVQAKVHPEVTTSGDSSSNFSPTEVASP